MEQWKSPRLIAEEERQYLYHRFEYFMGLVDDGILTEEEAVETLKQEIDDGEL